MALKLSYRHSIILVALVTFVTAATFFIASLYIKEGVSVFAFRPTALILLGSALFLISTLGRRRKLIFFLSMNIFFGGLLLLISRVKEVPLTIRQMWPLETIFCALSLIPLSFYGTKRLLAKYLIPAIILALFGIVALPFSLGLTKMSFRAIFAKWFPIVVLIAIVLIVLLFFYQFKIRHNFPYIVDEPDALCDIKDNDNCLE